MGGSHWTYTRNEGSTGPGNHANVTQDFYPKLFADILVDLEYLTAGVFECPTKPNDGEGGSAGNGYGGNPSDRMFNYAANLHLNGDSGSIAAGSGVPTWDRPIRISAIKDNHSMAMLYGDASWATYVRHNLVGRIHNNRTASNFVFFDGHAETFRVDDEFEIFSSAYTSYERGRHFWLRNSWN